MKGLLTFAQQGIRESVPLLDFDDVYQQYVDRVARWAARLRGPDLDVEDLVQEVFIVVHRQLAQFRGDAKLSTWLYRITEKLVLDRRRTERRRRLLRGLFGTLSGQVVERTPGVALEERQSAQLVYRVLDGMGEKYRAVIILFELEGLSGDEVADLLGVPVATVWVRLHRARAQFRERVQALPGEAQAAVASSPLRGSLL
jgi:RNA polymerase sigma-70 factor (ECF subfamily)